MDGRIEEVEKGRMKPGNNTAPDSPRGVTCELLPNMTTIDGGAKSGSGTMVCYSMALASLLGKEINLKLAFHSDDDRILKLGQMEMINIKERYLVDDNGNRIGVVLDIKDYHSLLQELEELDSICVCDAAKASRDEVIPFEQAVMEIESYSRY